MYNANTLLTIIVVIHSLGRTNGHNDLEFIRKIAMKLIVAVHNLLNDAFFILDFLHEILHS